MTTECGKQVDAVAKTFKEVLIVALENGWTPPIDGDGRCSFYDLCLVMKCGKAARCPICDAR